MTRSARFAVLAAALLFSTGGAAIKVAAFSTLQVSAFRSGIAALVLALWYRRQFAWTRWTVPAALAYTATLTLFVAATRMTTAANAIFLQSTAPIYLLVLAPWLLRERVTRQDVGYILVIAGGMALCFLGQPTAIATAPNPDAGNLLGVGSGIAWALTLIGLRHFNRSNPVPGHREPGITVVVVGNAIACAIALPWILPLPNASAGEWGTVVYLGVVQIALAYVCLTIAIRRLPALEASLLLLLEPALNPVWTWLIRDEVPGRWTIVGGAAILGATAMRTWSSSSVLNQETPMTLRR